MDIVPDDVVISGVGGYFPKALNIEEFKQRLFENKVLVEPRWPDEKNICNQIGCVPSDYFDNSYFGIHRQQCIFMDPMHRLALERAFEAIIDAGVSPTEIRGKRVGVFMGSTIGENDQLFMESVVSGFGVTGHSRAMLANRISYWLNLKGPSVAYDANWISGMEILRLAYYAIKTGQCEAMIIGTTNLAQYMEFQFMYNQLGLLSSDGSTRAFDINATGYCRSEGVVVMYIQRSSEARRHYASIVNIATKFDGTSSGDFMDIDSDKMVEFLEEFYKNSKVKPEEIDFVEAYGCGIKNTDKSEVDALERVYCKNRTEPLLIGSVKTVTGHSEPTAALFSIVKTIIAMETDTIPATLQYDKPNPDIKSLNNGKIEVVTTNRKWDPKYAAVNAIGTSAYFGHVVLKANPKKKVDISMNLPILLTASTRSEEGMTNIIETLNKKPNDPEYHKLIHDLFSKSIQGHLYRGYLLKGKEETKQETINHMGNKRQIWFVYSGMGSQWNGMLGDLMQIDIFAESIKRSEIILAKKGVDLMKVLCSPDKTIFDNILNSFVGIAAMQIALTDVLKALGIVPDGIIGHSVGELGCAYADGCMTPEQMIMSSYSRGRASLEATLVKGMMAATGLGYNQIKDQLPPTIEVACHNGPDSCTISGPTEDMEKYVNELTSKGVFAKLVNVANIAYHSRYIKPAGPLLLKYMHEVLPKPTLRSSKWISTSNLESNWDTDLAKYSSADYHTNNLLNSVLFEEGIKHIPADSVLIEIAPHGLLQAILKRSVKECTSIPLTQRGSKSATEFLFNNLGKLYLSGVDMNLSCIYPKVEYPVSRNTPTLTDLVHWNHTENWSRSEEAQQWAIGVKNVDVNLSSEEFSYCESHKLNNQVVLPISTYLNIILQITENAFGGYGVTFENIVFKKQLVVPTIGYVTINAMVQHGSGEFEIFSDDELVVSGKITVIDDKDDMEELENLQIPITKESIQLSENDVYSELKHRGYKYEGEFKRIKNLNLSPKGSSANTEWNKKLEDLLESMIQQQLFLVGERNQNVHVPKLIQKISIIHALLPEDPTDLTINFRYSTRTLCAPGIEINNMETVPFITKLEDVQLNSNNIISLDDHIVNNIENGIEQALQLTINNFKDPNIGKIHIFEIQTSNSLQRNIKNVVSNYSYLNVNSSLMKSAKQVLIIDSIPQLLILNDIVTSDVLKLLSTSSNAFLLTKIVPNQKLDHKIAIVARFRIGQEHYVICRKATNDKPSIITIKEKVISIKDLQQKSIQWVKELFSKTKESVNIPFLVTSTIPAEGFKNFLNEIRTLPNLENTRLFFNLDQNAAKIDEAFKKDLSLVILKNNHWLTYLPFLFKLNDSTENTTTATPIIPNSLINYIGLNLKDETITPDLKNKNEIGNIDYCGVSKNGQRIMGLAYLDKESCKLVVDDTLTWEVPKDFDLEEAVTIPHAYVSAYYMMVIKGKLKYGDSVLIHGGCSAIGLAALSVAYSYGCQVYTTVSTNRQKAYLKKNYVFLKDRNILYSNSITFESAIMTATGGSGVEVILNCVSGSSLKSSLACLAIYGNFIQYGKYDLEEGTTIGMSIFLKNVGFHHVDLQKIFFKDQETKQEIRDLVSEGIKKYVVRPLRSEIISFKNISTVMKKLESPEIIGKIIIDGANNLSVNKLNVKEPHRFICNSRSSYLIFGGPASSWISIAEWLVYRGARKIVISTNSKPTENHLNRRLTILENYFGADIILASSKLNSKDSAARLVSEVVNLGPLRAAFVVSNENNNIINDHEIVELLDTEIRSSSPKALLVNLISTASGVCYKRSTSGYSSVNIQTSDEEEIRDIVLNLDSILSSNCNDLILKKRAKGDTAEDVCTGTIKDLTTLIPTLDDIIQLQRNAPDEPDLVQVLTEGPSEIRELAPVFIVPGLTGFKELETFTRNLLYPAFCVVLPSKIWSLKKLAEVYAQKMSETFRKDVYNIVSISSGGPLAIEIARELAKKNANLHLYFIDSAPIRIQQGLQDIDGGLQVELTLLRTVFDISDLEVLNQLKTCKDFETRIKQILQRIDQSERNKALLLKGLIAAKDLMEKVKSFKANNELLPGKVHLLVPDDCTTFDNYGLSSFFKNPPTVSLVAGDHLSIIKNRETHEYVNRNHFQN